MNIFKWLAKLSAPAESSRATDAGARPPSPFRIRLGATRRDEIARQQSAEIRASWRETIAKLPPMQDGSLPRLRNDSRSAEHKSGGSGILNMRPSERLKGWKSECL